MPAAVRPKLKPGKVYRTKELAKYSKNAPRVAKRLVSEGELHPLAHGLFVHPESSKFGPVPPSREALMSGYLNRGRFIFSGPEQWNSLGLGSTALFATQLVYNEGRSGEVQLGGRHFTLRRVAFPENPSAEYYAVDLMKNHRKAGVSLETIEHALTKAIAQGRFKPLKLRRNAKHYGTRSVETVVENAITAAAESA